MYVMLTCHCPKLHRVEIKHKLKGTNASEQYINKTLLEEKIPGYCRECKETTVFRIEGMSPVPVHRKEKYRGVLPDRDDYRH